ncbi:hypothetical protein QYM36_008507 [Artemia franciscana]|uniref:Uncharacterized protein n=1 Tax=Artemia franciscana TaxID=6661 RepID=A0AA88LEZ8_ARTSF|nr:hypothetical protein QYM36_008507 [Artemia franciscana]
MASGKDGFLEALRFLSPINMKDSRSIADIADLAREIAIGASSDVAQAEWLLFKLKMDPVRTLLGSIIFGAITLD